MRIVPNNMDINTDKFINIYKDILPNKNSWKYLEKINIYSRIFYA